MSESRHTMTATQIVNVLQNNRVVRIKIKGSTKPNMAIGAIHESIELEMDDGVVIRLRGETYDYKLGLSVTYEGCNR